MGDDICNTAYTFTATDGSSSEFYDLYFGFHKKAPYYTFLFSPPRAAKIEKRVLWGRLRRAISQGRRKRPHPAKSAFISLLLVVRAISQGRRKRPHPAQSA